MTDRETQPRERVQRKNKAIEALIYNGAKRPPSNQHVSPSTLGNVGQVMGLVGALFFSSLEEQWQRLPYGIK